jgi:hypothetical protein
MGKARDDILRLVELSQDYYVKAYPLLVKALSEFKNDSTVLEAGGTGFIYGSVFAYFESAISTMNLALLLGESCIAMEGTDIPPVPPTSTTLN